MPLAISYCGGETGETGQTALYQDLREQFQEDQQQDDGANSEYSMNEYYQPDAAVGQSEDKLTSGVTIQLDIQSQQDYMLFLGEAEKIEETKMQFEPVSIPGTYQNEINYVQKLKNYSNKNT